MLAERQRLSQDESTLSGHGEGKEMSLIPNGTLTWLVFGFSITYKWWKHDLFMSSCMTLAVYTACHSAIV
jgi:hypothetical protein